MAKNETAMVPAPPAPLANKDEAPAYLQKHQGKARGFDEVERDDQTLPRLVLTQDMTPQRKKANPLHIPGLEEGLYFNSVTGKIYGTTVEFIPLFFFKQQIKFLDIETGGGIDCISMNGVDGGKLHPSDCATCPHNQFEDGEPPECTALKNFASLLLPDLELIIVSFKSTGIKVAKQLNSLARLSKRDMFARIYRLTSVDQKKGELDFKGNKLEPLGWVPEKFYLEAERYFNELSKVEGIKVDTRGMSEETEVDTEFETKGM
jgi:hypothetical protein